MTKTRQYQHCISAIHWLETSGALALGAIFVIFVLGVICASGAQAQTYNVLHRFQGSPADGAVSDAGVIGDSAGNLYGTTFYGGASGYGVVFKVDETGETVLYSFTGGADGANPVAGLVRDSAGNLYGTTNYGGAGCSSSGCGVVFKLDTTGKQTVLYTFTGGADGAYPFAPVIQDSAGNLYGTTNGGGIISYKCNGCGVVFKLDTTGTETVLHSFTGGGDGGFPVAGLVRDPAGNLYGTTRCGGTGESPFCFAGAGVLYKLDTTGKETVLYSFIGGGDGGSPQAGVIRDSAGNLYGTTFNGGNLTCSLYGSVGCGVVFKVDTTGKETVLYSFTGGADGAGPLAGVKRDSVGNLYGTTTTGGIINGYCSGCGVVFKLTP